jgi:hypothetical protein
MIRFTFDKWTFFRAVFEYFKKHVWNENLPFTSKAEGQSFCGKNNDNLVKFLCILSYYNIALQYEK